MDNPNSLTITIGRNIGTEPMMFAAWRSFRLHVFCICVDAITDEGDSNKLVFQYQGETSWNGITEESYKVELIGELDMEYVKSTMIERLQKAALTFQQDAIAYTLGTSNLVMPTIPELPETI